jgi:hypothetical protein
LQRTAGPALLPGVALALAFAVATPAAAQDNWCIQLTNDSGAMRCGFATFEQCSAVRGYGGGFCVTSPYGTGPLTPTPTRPRARRNR